LKPREVIVEAEKAALPYMHRVIAHIGKLEPHIGDRYAKLGKRHVFTVYEADAPGAVRFIIGHTILYAFGDLPGPWSELKIWCIIYARPNRGARDE
jgi:hypothetical protein